MAKKPAKKAKKSPTKKSASKPAKKAAKKTASRTGSPVAKKAAKKASAKPAKKAAKKSAKKAAKKKSRTTVVSSSKGKKLRALGAADGTSKDVQSSANGQAADIRRHEASNPNEGAPAPAADATQAPSA